MNPYGSVSGGYDPSFQGGYDPSLYSRLTRSGLINTGGDGGGYGSDSGSSDSGSSDSGGGGGGDGGGGDGGGGDSGGWAKGGKVTKSRLKGRNPPGPDDGYGLLQHGEYVIKKSAVNKYGAGLLDMINDGKIPAKKMKSLLG